jgi:hypothetical protein
MILSKGRLYPLLLLLTAGGYLWLAVSNDSSRILGWDGCLIRHFLQIPCPSCGTTRAVRAVFHGEWIEALYYNPLGILLAALMVAIPVWIAADLLLGTSSLLRAYSLTEQKLQSRPIAVTAILAIIANWIWNFVKYT